MNNWRKVDEIIEYFGKGVTPKYVDESSIIVLNQKCIRNNRVDFSLAQYIDESKEYNENKFLKIGDILVNSTGQGTAGRVAFLEFIPKGKRVIVDSHILVLRTKDFYESRCLNYSLFSIENILQTYIDGSTGQGEFDRVRLFNVKVNYPTDRKTQQKIAKVLSDLDAKIELNNRINAELEAMAKLVYEYWFVQFDFPVVTLSGVEGYKSSGGKMVWNEELKREVPEGWEVVQIKDIAKTGSGGTPLSTKSEYYENGNIPWINSGEVNNPFIISCEKKITKEGLENSSAKLFPRGTILMAMYGATAGKVSLMDIEACTNQAICAIIPNQDSFRYFIKFKLESLYEFLINLSTGSARDNLSQEKIKELKIVIPVKHILDSFHKKVEPFMTKILENLKQNQELSRLRDWLLPMLMNGQITVTEAEERVEEELGMVAEKEREKYNSKQSEIN
jgi:type I restriction enzyme S subunit